jgi:hypothetical protein
MLLFHMRHQMQARTYLCMQLAYKRQTAVVARNGCCCSGHWWKSLVLAKLEVRFYRVVVSVGYVLLAQTAVSNSRVLAPRVSVPNRRCM